MRAEVVHCVRREMAVTMEDVLARRLGIQMYDWRKAIEAAPAVAHLLAQELGWPVETEAKSTEFYLSKIRGYMDLLGLAETGESGVRGHIQ